MPLDTGDVEVGKHVSLAGDGLGSASTNAGAA